MIDFGGGFKKISTVVISTMMGHSGSGDIFPLSLLPSYRAQAEEIKKYGKTVITKSITRHKRPGHYRWWKPRDTIKEIKENGIVIGLINSFGLRNDGVEACALKIRDSLNKGFRVIPSYFPEFMKGLDVAIREGEEAIQIFKDTLLNLFWAIEINCSCPNSGESLEQNESNIVAFVRRIRLIFNGVIIVKLSPVHSLALRLELESLGINVIHDINTFPHPVIFPNDQSPLKPKYGPGGYSGPFMFERAFEINTRSREALKIPMLMGCGISSVDHINRYWDMILKKAPDGALKRNAFSVCSILRIDEVEASRLIRM